MSNPPDPGAWRRVSPFAAVFFVGRTLRNAVRGYVQLVATFGAIAVIVRGAPHAPLLIPAAIAAVVAGAVLKYWFFRFRIAEDRILIRQGVFRKTALDLPFERIQGINVRRSPVDRLLGLVTVSMDTAGSGTTEGELPSVRAALADELRARIGAAARTREARPGTTAPPEEDRGRRDRNQTPGEPLLKLSGSDMVRIGIGRDNVLLAAMLIAAAWRRPRELPYRFAETFGFSEEFVRPAIETAEAAIAGSDAVGDTTFAGGLVLAALAVVLALGIGTALLRHHGFTLWREGTAYRSRGGLLTRREVAVKTARIQQLTLYQDAVMRCFRRYRLRVHPAADARASSHHDVPDVLEVPLLGARLADELRSGVFGREGAGVVLLPKSGPFTRVSRVYVQALLLRTGGVPALGGALLLLSLTGPTRAWAAFSGAWGLSWILIGGLVALQRWRRRGYLHDEDGLAVRSGLVGRRVDAFLFRKAQSVTVKRSPLERRRGLATLEIVLASDTLSVPCIEHGVARRLRDHILHKAETNRRWH